ncbi:MAG: HMA2 domain-containing protein [Thainema sp.]
MITSSTVEAQSASNTENSSQLGHLLEEYGEIAAILPVLTGLLVTSQLRLRGASALVVNIAIAAITRQAIVQLKKQAGYAPSTPALAATSTNGKTETAEEDYTIVHSVPGRIRLRIPRLQTEPAFGKRLEKLLLTQDIVLGVRINRAASSIAIRYDGTNLSELELGMRLLQILEQAEQETPNT